VRSPRRTQWFHLETVSDVGSSSQNLWSSVCDAECFLPGGLRWRRGVWQCCRWSSWCCWWWVWVGLPPSVSWESIQSVQFTGFASFWSCLCQAIFSTLNPHLYSNYTLELYFDNIKTSQTNSKTFKWEQKNLSWQYNFYHDYYHIINYCKCKFRFTKMKHASSIVSSFTPHCFNGLLICLSPVVFFSSSVCTWIVLEFLQHLPPPFLMLHLFHTSRFQCLIRTIHFFPDDSCWKKKSASKPPFQYQLWISKELHTLINRAWVNAGNSADRVKALRAKTALCCSRCISVWVPSALADYHTTSDMGIQKRPGGCSGPSSYIYVQVLLACMPVVCLTKWVMLCHVM